ncbi:MAG: DUF2249 domain-containing protein [Parvibaculum sp.]
MSAAGKTDIIRELNSLFIRALKCLGEAGESDAACRLAAMGWSLLSPSQAAEAQRLNGVLHYLTHPVVSERRRSAMSNSDNLDVRNLIPAQRHSLIFETWDKLEPGKSFVLVNDHDPKPLYYQFDAEHSGQFTWDYLESGPETWRVRIGRKAVA